MIRTFFFILFSFFLSNCSLNEDSKLWKTKNIQKDKNITTILTEEKKFSKEFNPKIKLDLPKAKNRIIDNLNNFGSLEYSGSLNKIGVFKFSKFKNINQLNFEPIFLKNSLIFFDNTGTIIRYDNNQKIIWKKNYYSKSEKKINPKLTFKINKNKLIIIDNLAKLHLINLENGNLIWSKNSDYPFNSEIKVYNDMFFAVDYKNIIRCFKLEDGSECWSLQTENSLTVSASKYSIITINGQVIFNNSVGDITAIDIETGLITWQLPTQNSNIINETYSFRTSKLVSDGNSIYFSNNKNEIYSINSENGSINWKNKINSNLTPIIIQNLIFTISEDGFLYTIEKKQGNIIRVNDIYKDYKPKKRKDIKPVGFTIGRDLLYLSNNDGKLIVVQLTSGSVLKVEKISSDLVSKPFIYDKNLFVIKNGSIIKYN